MIFREVQIQKNEYFCIKPSIDTLLAFLTVGLVWAAFLIMANNQSLAIQVIVFGIFANIFVCFVFPVFWVMFVKKEMLSSFGIRKENLASSLIIGSILGYFEFSSLLPLLKEINWISHLLCCFLFIWEPFFIFGWLQSRFEKSFGIIPGILLAGVSLGVYHIGSFNYDQVIILMINGLFFALVYSSIRNIFVFWPFFWTISSASGSLIGGLRFEFIHVYFYIVIFTIQILILVLAYNNNKNRNLTTVST
jgi:hypothetical protein